jgi:hypothetical protein
MAAPNLTTHLPIIQAQEKAGTTPFTSAQPELAGQTFAFGTPIQLSAGGFVQAWDGATVAAGILGVSESFGLNLGSNGAGAPSLPFGQVTGSLATQTYGSVPNQGSGVNIALGTPVSEGRTLYMSPNQDNIFEAMFDNSAGNVAADYTPTQADIGATYGMTKDTVGPYWYVDKGKTGASKLVQIVGIGPDGFVLNGRVRFVFLTAAIQVAG